MSEKEGYPGGCMTASGIMFYPLAPRVEDVRIEDIAHQLAATNRFSGATSWPLSVAQHSVIVSQIMGYSTYHDQDDPARRGLYGCLHDSAEAYLNDIPRPLKHHPDFACYREAEARLQAVIYEAFGLDPNGEPGDLKTVDRRVLRSEQAALMPPAAPNEDRNDVPVYPQIVFQRWTFEEARSAFLGRFHWLQRQLLAG